MSAEISRLYARGDYEQALERIQLARQSRLGTYELVTLFLYEGMVQFVLERPQESGDAFQMALLLQPDAKLPEQLVAPKVERHFALARRLAHEPAREEGARRPARDCPMSTPAASGKDLKAQQAWRLGAMERMLCLRGTPSGPVGTLLASLRVELENSLTHADRVRVSGKIDRIAVRWSLYPAASDWEQAKTLAPLDMREAVGEDPELPLPEAPPDLAEAEAPSEAPTNLFGCQQATVEACERLLLRLKLLRDEAVDSGNDGLQTWLQALPGLGLRVRQAATPEALEAVSLSIDAWAEKWN
ncbi:hypothetical protein [Melittangium boletus]|uniref:hypothetical protein n=1 Tax=Melittangium boletus TaxID=83453 RepID=UPI003DA549C3